jgi:hypothetical protein
MTPECRSACRGRRHHHVVEAHPAILENNTKANKDIVVLTLAPPAKNGKYASIDPSGNDFVCQCCSTKLSNIHYQCDAGAWCIYNVCHVCYSDEAHLRNKDRRHLSNRDEPCSSVNPFIGKDKKCCCESNSPCLECRKWHFCEEDLKAKSKPLEPASTLGAVASTAPPATTKLAVRRCVSEFDAQADILLRRQFLIWVERSIYYYYSGSPSDRRLGRRSASRSRT